MIIGPRLFRGPIGLSLLAAAVMSAGSPIAGAVTFDFRSSAAGGNVGDAFQAMQAATAAVDGLSITGDVSQPITGRREFNFTSGSSDLGIGIRSDAGARNNQIDVGEAARFTFDRPVRVDAITLQVFFLTASDGVGGPVSQENDAIEVALGANSKTIASPYNFSPPNPSTFTIELAAQGFATQILNAGEVLALAPTAGDGVRLRSIAITQIPEPTSLAMGVAFASTLVAVRRRRTRSRGPREIDTGTLRHGRMRILSPLNSTGAPSDSRHK